MSATTIISNGALYRAGQKTWVTHGRRRFHVFDRADSKGTRLDNGTVLDKHEIDLSTWQLENVNAEYFLLFDHPLYVKLKKSIAKTLLPLLHTWLFAARREERFEKLYPELCEALQITCYSHRSRITEQLQPALNELVKLEYLSKWELLKTSNTKTYKIAFYAGPKAFHTRRRQRKALPEPEEYLSKWELLKTSNTRPTRLPSTLAPRLSTPGARGKPYLNQKKQPAAPLPILTRIYCSSSTDVASVIPTSFFSKPITSSSLTA